MKTKVYLSLVFVFLLIVSCSDEIKKDIPKPNPEVPFRFDVAKENEKVAKVITTNTLTSSFIVDVQNVNGESISGAEVIIADKNAITQNTGIALIQNVKTNQNHTVVKVNKKGFEQSFRTIFPSKSKETIVKIVMIDEVAPVALDTKKGGVLAKDDVKIAFPAQSLVDKNGKIFKGEASVKIIHYNPNNENFESTYPGTLTGISDDNNEVGLATAGMLTVKITDASGNKLQVGNNKKVNVTMPAIANSPATISFWHLNEQYGLWVENGTATKKDGTYTFDVTHFSTYNLDQKIENPTEFCIEFKDENNKLYYNSDIVIAFKDELGNNVKKYFTTNDEGKICFRNGLKTDYNFYIISACDSEKKSEIKTVTVTDNKTYAVTLNKSTLAVDYQANKSLNFNGSISCSTAEIKPKSTKVILGFDRGDFSPLNFDIANDKTFKDNMKIKCLAGSSNYVRATPFLLDLDTQKSYRYNDAIFGISSSEIINVNLDLNCPKAEEKKLNFNDYFLLTENRNGSYVYGYALQPIDRRKIKIISGYLLDSEGNYFKLKRISDSALGFSGFRGNYLIFVLSNLGIATKKVYLEGYVKG